jgi:hypothetical protein
MFSSTSRYTRVPHFAPDPEGRPHFRGTRPRHVETLQPVVEHHLSAWDRPDLMAIHYFNDPERWWLLLEANPELMFAGELTLPQTASDSDADPAATPGLILVPRDPVR